MNTIANATELEFPAPAIDSVNYAIPKLELHRGPFIFSYLSTFLSFITPHELPVELLQDAFKARVSVVQLIFEALKIESGFICLISIFIIISIIPLILVIIWGCSSKSPTETRSTATTDSGLESAGNIDERTVPSSDSLLTLEDEIMRGSDKSSFHCRRRILQFLLQIVILLLIGSISAMFITNEQISSAINKTPEIVRASLKDVETFLKDAHKQIAFSVHEGLNTVIKQVKSDIDDIDKLLGEPIEKELELQTGIEVQFDEIQQICSSNNELIHRIQLMHASIAQAILVANEATNRIEELQIQLNVLQRQCVGRDRPLCETLKIKNFHENMLMEILIKLQTDPSLFKMLSLGEQRQNISGITRTNLSQELNAAKFIFHNYATNVKQNVTKMWTEIHKQFVKMKDNAQKSTNVLSSTVQLLIDRVDRTWSSTVPFLDDLEVFGNIIWALALSVSVATLLITMVLMGALSYGCCQFENRAGTTFVIGATTISIGSIALAICTVFTMLLGGHGEVFLCRPLHDTPHFNVLGKLIDRPGLVFANVSVNGIIGDLLKPPGFYSNYSHISTSLANAIQQCERNGASYQVFQMDGLMNLTTIVDLLNYPDLNTAIEKIVVTTDSFTTLTIPLQNLFEYIYMNSNIDFADYRMELSQPVPERDLSTFIDQMQRVSLQIQDVATSSRMTTLSNRARRLQTSVLQPLEQLKSKIIFHLTALELKKEPWSNQVNQSLLHLKTIQYYLNQDGEKICAKELNSFKSRLKNYFTANRNHLLTLLNDRLASCRPLFNIFDANRLLFCRHTMDPLNGLWFSGLLCLLLWIIATPLALALANIYRQMNFSSQGLRHTNSHQYGTPSDSLIISEQSNWPALSSQRTSANIDRSNW